MAKCFASLVRLPVRVWQRLNRFLHERAERQVDAWASSLQYKRRYTNPDVVKQHRQTP